MCFVALFFFLIVPHLINLLTLFQRLWWPVSQVLTLVQYF